MEREGRVPEAVRAAADLQPGGGSDRRLQRRPRGLPRVQPVWSECSLLPTSAPLLVESWKI